MIASEWLHHSVEVLNLQFKNQRKIGLKEALVIIYEEWAEHFDCNILSLRMQGNRRQVMRMKDLIILEEILIKKDVPTTNNNGF